MAVNKILQKTLRNIFVFVKVRKIKRSGLRCKLRIINVFSFFLFFFLFKIGIKNEKFLFEIRSRFLDFAPVSCSLWLIADLEQGAYSGESLPSSSTMLPLTFHYKQFKKKKNPIGTCEIIQLFL